MNTLLMARSIKSVLTVFPDKRKGSIELVEDYMDNGSGRTDAEAIHGDFLAVGNDMRRAITTHVQTLEKSEQQNSLLCARDR